MLDGYMMGFKAGYLFCICATVFFFFFFREETLLFVFNLIQVQTFVDS